MKDLKPATIAQFFYWINERHRIYLNRQKGQPKPWTADPILQQYKFTNAFRQLDTGTVWLTEYFIKPYWHGADLLLFNIAWYRLFNWIGTGSVVGYIGHWNRPSFVEVLKKHRAAGNQVFTNAHMTHGEKGRDKIETMADAMNVLWDQRQAFYLLARESKSLEKVFKEIIQIRSIGKFIGYEIITDLRHTPILNDATDIMTWANPGPGAKRGMYRLREHLPADGILGMQHLLQISPNFIQPHVPTLEMRDIEHSLCEFDKYMRVFHGEGTPRMKYNGKA